MSHSKIDYERTLLHFHAGGGIVRLSNYVGIVSYYGGTGGMSDRDKQTELTAAKAVAKRWPQYVTKVLVKKSGKTTLRLKSLSKPVVGQTEKATAAAAESNRGDARANPACPNCSARGKNIVRKTEGVWFCKLCPCKFSKTAYAERRRKCKKARRGNRNAF